MKNDQSDWLSWALATDEPEEYVMDETPPFVDSVSFEGWPPDFSWDDDGAVLC